MQLHETYLPAFILPYITKSLSFQTEIIKTYGGREYRFASSPFICLEYLINNCLLSTTEFSQFMSFFQARKGPLHPFLLHDKTDYEGQNIPQALGGEKQQTSFSLIKIYPDEIAPHMRKIQKPHNLQLYINENEINAEFDTNTATIILPYPLEEGSILTADFQFDVIVRFDIGDIQYKHTESGAIELSPIKLVEVLL